MELVVRPGSDERVVLYEEGHRYVVGEGITERDAPSYSAVMKSAGLSTDYSEVDPTHLQFRAAVGTCVHAAIECYMSGGTVTREPCDPLIERAAEPHFDCFLRWLKKHELVTHVAEVPAYNQKLKYCATVDWIGLLDGEPWILDWKTVYKIARNVGYQTMAQRLCFQFYDGPYGKSENRFDEVSPYRGALHLPKRGPAEVVEFKDDQFDRETVEASAQCWKARWAV